MLVRRLHVRNFRGFLDLPVEPDGNIVVLGPPGSGRSDLIEALGRVLDTIASRTRITTELDFHNRDTTHPIQITLTLADLGPSVEQLFLDHLELWDAANDHIVVEAETPESVDQGDYEWVLRLEYWARWLPDEERCEEWVHYPKDSDPDADFFAHARRSDIETLGFGLLRWSGGRMLELGGRSAFRRVIERADGGDFAAALDHYVSDVAQAAAQFTESSQVQAALEEVVEPLQEVLGLDPGDPSGLVQFQPEGGSTSGLLRSLGPSIDLQDGVGHLPAWRHGSTRAVLFRIAESLALSARAEPILAIDDLGDGLDAASAAHLAAVIRRTAGQAWVTTRLPAVAEVFEPQEVLRLDRDASGQGRAWCGKKPKTKAEAVAAKHWHRNLLPAFSYRSVVVVEGPNDFAALHTLALRRAKEQGERLPATWGIALINAGMMGSGGYQNVLKLAGTARDMGLRAIGVVDGDRDSGASQYLAANHTLADAVVRLPDQTAIEIAISGGLPDEVLRQALVDVAASAGLPPPDNLDTLAGPDLLGAATWFIKRNSLHSAFVEALPGDSLPPLGVALLDEAMAAAAGTAAGILQL